MTRILAILGMLLAAFFAVRWAANAPAEKVARMLRRAAGAALVLAGGFISLRGGWEIGGPLALFGLGMMISGRNPFSRGQKASGSGGDDGKGGKASRVRTKMLLMELDHASGRMDGEVLAGRFSGRKLSGLSLAELRLLHGECAGAGDQSLKLLEAWLDRTHPGWREEPGAAGGGDDGPMTAARAREILGLAPGADEAAIRAAHRRMMKAAHPDHGGSDWMARQVNAARDVLLAELGKG
jgi:hypothetical protein